MLWGYGVVAVIILWVLVDPREKDKTTHLCQCRCPHSFYDWSSSFPVATVFKIFATYLPRTKGNFDTSLHSSQRLNHPKKKKKKENQKTHGYLGGWDAQGRRNFRNPFSGADLVIPF